MGRIFFRLMGLCLSVATVGCGGATVPDPVTAESIVRKYAAPRVIIESRSGQELEVHELIGILSTKRAIYVAERHDRALDHAAQNAILRALFKAEPSLTIGFEMFQTPFQEALDEWTNGLLDEAALRRKTEYDQRWGYNFGFYRPMLEFARKWSIPLVALNAPAELTEKVADGGVAALTSEEREALPELDLDSAAHRALFDANFDVEAHGGPDAAHRFYTAQVIWDETMAATVAEVLAEPDSRAHMLVFAGRVHIEQGLGVPGRAARRGAKPYVTVMPVTKGEVDDLMQAPPEARAADYFWVTR